jgi:ATP-dependent Clp protease protease subunit
MYNDFQKFALSQGISSLTLHRYSSSVNDGIISPNIVEERTGNPLQIDVFSKLFTSRILFLGTPIDADVANIINSQLLYLQMDNEKAPISLYINTPGGSVTDGLSIYDTMNYIKCPVHTTCIGLAASMGSILLTAGEKGNRAALPHSRVLIHQPLGGTGYAQASDIAIVNEEIQKHKQELFRILAEHSGNDYEKMVQLGDRDYWMSATEAVDLGLIDKVITRE